jgi:hypothetical protein
MYNSFVGVAKYRGFAFDAKIIAIYRPHSNTSR